VGVRAAAHHAIDKHALSDMERIGITLPLGLIMPREFEFAWHVEPCSRDPEFRIVSAPR